MGEYDADLRIFSDEFVPNVQASKTYQRWAKSSPGDRGRWEAFRDALLAGQMPTAPSMSTTFGSALVAAGKEHMSISQLVGTVTDPYPSVPGIRVAPPQAPLPVNDGQFLFDYGYDVGGSTAAAGGTLSHQTYTRYIRGGARILAWNPLIPSTGTWNISDLDIYNITANPPRSLDGVAEAGLQIGQRANVSRVRTRNCAWMGVETYGMCDGSVFEDIEATEQPHVGIYCEHVTRNTTFRRIKIDAVDVGFNVEWWYTDAAYGPFLPYGGKAGSYNLVIEDFDIHCTGGGSQDWDGWCFWLDAGTFNVTIRNGKLSGMHGIAYPAPSSRVDPGGYINIDWASIDTSGLTGQVYQEHTRAIG